MGNFMYELNQIRKKKMLQHLLKSQTNNMNYAF